MGKISINISVFDNNISSLRTAASSVNFSPQASLSKTDINPFKEYEQSIQDLSKLISQYKSILENDAQQLSAIGAAIVAADKKSMGAP